VVANPDQSASILLRTEHFRIEHARYYRIAGLLFVIPVQPVRQIGDMNEPALRELGPILALAGRALAEVLEPINVYYAKLGESGGPLHFHVFPRTTSITDAYLEEHPEAGNIDGPALMSWANRKYSGASGLSHGDIPSTMASIKTVLQALAPQR
jgi:diadenosine tetraphosphate (Ap4A) HIT family hydrolase